MSQNLTQASPVTISSHEIEKHRIKCVLPLLEQGQANMANAKRVTQRRCLLLLLISAVFAVVYALSKWTGLELLSFTAGDNRKYALYAVLVMWVLTAVVYLMGKESAIASELYDNIINRWGELFGWNIEPEHSLENFLKDDGAVKELIQGEVGLGLNFAEITGVSQSVKRQITFQHGRISSCDLSYEIEVNEGEDEDGVSNTRFDRHRYFTGLLLHIPVKQTHSFILYPSKEFGGLTSKRADNLDNLHNLPRVNADDVGDDYHLYSNFQQAAYATQLLELLEGSPWKSKKTYISAYPHSISIALNTEETLDDTDMFSDNADRLILANLQNMHELLKSIHALYEPL